jgi:hypothetical protein
VRRFNRSALLWLLILFVVPLCLGAVTIIDLTFQVTGILPTSHGGTGLGTLTSNVVYKGNGTGNMSVSSVTDDGTTLTSTDTGGMKAPTFISTGTTAGFVDYPQGTTSSAVAPCNVANSICEQAPTAVTAYVLTRPGAAPAINNSLKFTSTAGVESYTGTLQPTQNPNGIQNFNSAAQSQVVVSATEYYITSSNLPMPAVYTTPIGAGTVMRWHVAMTKTAAGTGTFQILQKYGTNGTTGDTTNVTTTIGTQTAALDDMTFDLTITFTSATAYYWSLVPRQTAITATGFGLVFPAAATYFSGTVTGLTTTTASLKFGLSFKATTGTPTIVVPMVQAEAFGVN